MPALQDTGKPEVAGNVVLPPTIVQISPGCPAEAFCCNAIPQPFFRHLLPAASSPSQMLTSNAPHLLHLW